MELFRISFVLMGMDLSTLTDDELRGKVEALAETERFSLTDFLLHLGELDRRENCKNWGYSSIFAYLTRKLGYAECDAMRRVRSARAVRRFPSILGMIVRGDLNIVGLSMLQPHLTSENHRQLLAKACRRTQREIEALAAALAPHARGPRDRIRILPGSAQPPESVPSDATVTIGDVNALPISNDQARAAVGLNEGLAIPANGEFMLTGQLSSEAGESALTLDSDKNKLRRLFSFSVGEKVYELFLQARDLLRHKYPEGKMEEIMGEALELLVEMRLLRKIGRPKRKGKRKRRPVPAELNPRKSWASASRNVPRNVRREVWERDGGKCSFIGPEGVRCREKARLEFDHKIPWALGGPSDDPKNIRLLCRAHNQLEGREKFGGPRADEGENNLNNASSL